ncbi:hypothetical protein QMK61_15795 [Fulvimonas sp. R45]|uniref:hypothetical protein n=1 Tax=Fulvimonas sp. R45 TaxID=3045937 RepID=UPI00265FF27F|nr:hypothetical protein [Fulvimonas sp. R45]MDO1530300.1 hypothetical protein [Fulvimonas sp. R45]
MDTLLHAIAPCAGAFLLGFATARLFQRRPAPQAPPPDESIGDAQIEAEVRAGRTVEALRLYRRRYACDLRQAKEAIDDLARRKGLID